MIPSIALIPFENKGSTEEDYFAWSISTDLIAELSSKGIIRVASYNDIEKIDVLQRFRRNPRRGQTMLSTALVPSKTFVRLQMLLCQGNRLELGHLKFHYFL